jgi:hypothetical protein
MWPGQQRHLSASCSFQKTLIFRPRTPHKTPCVKRGFQLIFGAFFTLKVWWISSTYNDRFNVLLAPAKHVRACLTNK